MLAPCAFAPVGDRHDQELMLGMPAGGFGRIRNMTAYRARWAGIESLRRNPAGWCEQKAKKCDGHHSFPPRRGAA
jgi:hypothetical protein